MSNKVRKIKVRRSWVINPRTRVKESGRIYSRRKVRTEIKKILKEEV